MFCSGCGETLKDSAAFCEKCGRSTSKAEPEASITKPTPIAATATDVTRTSGLAIASLVLGIFWIYGIGSTLAIIFGHVSLAQMKKDSTIKGRGLAIAGLVLGYLALILLVLFVVILTNADWG